MTKIGRPLVMTVEDRCKEIYAVAEKLFGEKGFANVTMAEIATASGMSKKTLYVHFPDKRELFKSLVSSSYLWSEQVIQCEMTDQPIQQLKQHLETIAKYALSERHLKLCRLAIAENFSSEGMADTFYQLGIAASRQNLIDSIKCIPQVAFRITLDAGVLADMLFGAVVGTLLIDSLMATHHHPHDFVQIEQNIDQVVDALFI